MFICSRSLWTYRWRLHLTFPHTAQLWPRGNSSCSCRCWKNKSPISLISFNQTLWTISSYFLVHIYTSLCEQSKLFHTVSNIYIKLHYKSANRLDKFKNVSAKLVWCLTYFISWLYGEEDVWEKGLWSKGAIERDDTSQEWPEDHQDVDIPGERVIPP